MKALDITGQRYSRLVAIKKIDKKWLCKCDCGNEVLVTLGRLRSGNTKSCGCAKIDMLIQRNKDMARHNQFGTRIYNIWGNIKYRCDNSKSWEYDNYGGRGIKMCDEWSNDFVKFYEWSMSNGYQDNLTIDRINNDKGYSPDNCRWATLEDQLNNTRKNVFITIDGITKTMAQWAREYDINPHTVAYRLHKMGLTGKDLFKKPQRGC